MSSHDRKSPKPKSDGSDFYFLDQFSVLDLEKWNQFYNETLKFEWDLYCELAFKRSQIREQIRESLLYAVEQSFRFSKWQRVVKYQWAFSPLSAKGSLTYPGGRFNIGEIDKERFAAFPALYISEDKETALCEVLGQEAEMNTTKLTPWEIALTSPTSIANVSVSGAIETVINLNNPKLKNFVNLVKDFHISPQLGALAKKLKFPPPATRMIRSIKELQKFVLKRNWRLAPMQYDVPAPGQIFGQLVAAAGIEGIVYPSRFTKKLNLVVFPKNFEKSNSFISLDDKSPEEVCRKLDNATWKKLC